MSLFGDKLPARIALLLAALLLAGLMFAIAPAFAAESDAGAPLPDAAETELFEKEIRPLLVERCYQCHGDLKEPKGNLSLLSREALLRGGDSGPAAVPGKPGESLLIAAINYDGLEMPPEGKKLSPPEI